MLMVGLLWLGGLGQTSLPVMCVRRETLQDEIRNSIPEWARQALGTNTLVALATVRVLEGPLSRPVHFAQEEPPGITSAQTTQVATIDVQQFLRSPPQAHAGNTFTVAASERIAVGETVLVVASEEYWPSAFRGEPHRIGWANDLPCEPSLYHLDDPRAVAYRAAFDQILAHPDAPAELGLYATIPDAPAGRSSLSVRLLARSAGAMTRTVAVPVNLQGFAVRVAPGRYDIEWPQLDGLVAVCGTNDECRVELPGGTRVHQATHYQPRPPETHDPEDDLK